MSWTRRLMVAGLIGVAQAGVVVALAQCWQSSSAANPPCNVSCARDTVPDARVPEPECPQQRCPSSVVASPLMTPPNPAPIAPPTPYEPPSATELRAVPPPAIEESKGSEPISDYAPPAPVPVVLPSPAGNPYAAETEVRPVPPTSRLQDPDAGAVMPTPVAPSAQPTPDYLDETPRYTPPAPVAPEMKPVPPVAEPVPAPPPPPPAQEPPPPPAIQPTPYIDRTAATVPEPLPNRQTVTCPWTLRIENIDGRAHLEARNGKEVQFRVICAELDVQAPRGYIQAVGDVVVSGHELHGTCKKLTINWHDEHVLLDGGVDLRCRKNGEEIEVKGEKLSFRLSVISTIRADSTSDSPVRRAVID